MGPFKYTHLATRTELEAEIDRLKALIAAPAPVARGEPCSDKRLTLIASRFGLHALTGKDRADMLAFGRACMADALAAPAPAPAPVALTPAQQHADELESVLRALRRAGGIWPDLHPRVCEVLEKIEGTRETGGTQ